MQECIDDWVLHSKLRSTSGTKGFSCLFTSFFLSPSPILHNSNFITVSPAKTNCSKLNTVLSLYLTKSLIQLKTQRHQSRKREEKITEKRKSERSLRPITFHSSFPQKIPILFCIFQLSPSLTTTQRINKKERKEGKISNQRTWGRLH